MQTGEEDLVHQSEYGFFKEFTAGTVSGIASIVVIHPADTLKVRLQTFNYKNTFDCLRSSVKQEGLFCLFKGIVPPLLGIGLINACLFAANAETKNHLYPDRQILSIRETSVCGGIAGFVQCAVTNPIELVKTRLQIDRSPGGSSMSVWQMTRYLHQHLGWKWSLFGMGASVTREVPGYASYFAVYEYMKRRLTASETLPSGLIMLFSGACAGVASWTLVYPIDMVKSRVQAQSIHTGPSNLKNSIHLAKEIFRKEGFTSFWRGYPVTILRTIPSSGVTFLFYELTLEALSKL